MANGTQVKAVYSIRENSKGDTFWNRMGVAFVNQDDSLNVVLDALPVDGKLHIREMKRDEKTDSSDRGSSRNSGRNGSSRNRNYDDRPRG